MALKTKLLGLVGSAAILALPAGAWAQESNGQPGGPPPAATSGIETTANTPPTPTEDEQTERAKFRKFDQNDVQGITTNFPGNYDSLLQDYGGWRSWLYDHGLFVKGETGIALTDDVNGGKSPTSPQAFNGQKPSYNWTSNLVGTLKIDGDGTDIGQVVAQLLINQVNYDPNGPNHVGFMFMQVYQTFFKRAIEVSAGFGTNNTTYAGIFAGGNPILANGVSGTVPVETGVSASTASEPFVNVQLNFGQGYYSRTGVQRSIEPAGLVTEAKTNGVSLNIDQPGGGRALYIEEVGVRRLASPDQHQLWIRAGGLYNSTQYHRFDGRGTDSNWAAYLLGDYQVLQPYRTEPYKGVYVGGSVLAAPDDVNVYTRTYEFRTYAIGMVPGRPGDSMTFSVDYNKFSNAADRARELLDAPEEPYQFSAGFLYAIHIRRGIYFSPSIAYILHPTFAGRFSPAVNATGNLILLF